MMKELRKIDKYLSSLGITIAGLLLSLLSVGLMIFPGVIFSFFLIKVVWFFMGSQDFISLDDFVLLALLSVASWYLGKGVDKLTKNIDETEKKA